LETAEAAMVAVEANTHQEVQVATAEAAMAKEEVAAAAGKRARVSKLYCSPEYCWTVAYS
jgi:hypothetical protein